MYPSIWCPRSPVTEARVPIWHYKSLSARLIHLVAEVQQVPADARTASSGLWLQLDEELKNVQQELQSALTVHHHPLQAFASGHTDLSDKVGPLETG